jgi:uncharacterized protein involved in type VI secretion and phage assembly
MNGPPYFGKYRGIVTVNEDPLKTGRIRAKVPDVLGDEESGWAMACVPFAGKGAGFYAVPDVGVGVWIEFEQGDPDYPIYTGCWWGSFADVPPEALLVPPLITKIVIKSFGGHIVAVDDTPGIGGILLQTSTGQKISLTALGIEIDNGQGGAIKMLGPMVSVNNGALDVI